MAAVHVADDDFLDQSEDDIFQPFMPAAAGSSSAFRRQILWANQQNTMQNPAAMNHALGYQQNSRLTDYVQNSQRDMSGGR